MWFGQCRLGLQGQVLKAPKSLHTIPRGKAHQRLVYIGRAAMCLAKTSSKGAQCVLVVGALVTAQAELLAQMLFQNCRRGFANWPCVERITATHRCHCPYRRCDLRTRVSAHAQKPIMANAKNGFEK